MKHFNLYQLTILALITAGIAIRLININQPLLEFFPQRQTQTAEITRNIYKNGWTDFWTPKVRYFTNGEPIPYVLEFPLYNGIVAALYHLFGPNVIWGRIVSLISFVGSTLIFYRLFRTYPDFSPEKSAGTPEPRARALATHGRRPWEQVSVVLGSPLFFIFSPLHILISRSFQPEELALFLLLLAIYKRSWLIFSLTVLTKLPVALFAPVIFVSSSLRGAKRRGNLNDILKCGLSLIPSIIWYLRASRLTVHPAISRNFDVANWFQPQLWLNPKWYFSLFQIEHIWILTTLGLLFFWIGFWRIIIQRKLLAVRQGVSLLDTNIWIIWLASGLFYLGIFNYHAMTHEYYHLFLLPPLSIFVGTGLNQIVKITKEHPKSVRIASVTGIIFLFIMGLIQPAIKKIISAPRDISLSEEVDPNRYRLIEDF